MTDKKEEDDFMTQLREFIEVYKSRILIDFVNHLNSDKPICNIREKFEVCRNDAILSTLTPKGLNRLLLIVSESTQTTADDIINLIKRGADLFYREPGYSQSLYCLIHTNSEEFLLQLVDYLPPIIANSHNDWTFVYIALIDGKYKIVSELLKRGVDMSKAKHILSIVGETSRKIFYSAVYFPTLMLLTKRSRVYFRRPILPKELIQHKLYSFLVG